MFPSLPAILCLSILVRAAEVDDPFTIALPATSAPTVVGGYAHFEGTLNPSPGKPSLPGSRLTVLVAPDADLKTLAITVLDTVAKVLDGEYLVQPGPPMGHFDITLPLPVFVPSWPEGMVVVDGKDMAVYGTNAWYPSERFRVQTGMMGQYKLVDVFLNPFVYNPKTKKLRSLVSGRIRVSYSRIPDFVQFAPTRTPRYEETLLGIIDNDTAVFQLYGALPTVEIASRAHARKARFEGLRSIRDGIIQLPAEAGTAPFHVVVHQLDGRRLFSGVVRSSRIALPTSEPSGLVIVRLE